MLRHELLRRKAMRAHLGRVRPALGGFILSLAGNVLRHRLLDEMLAKVLSWDVTVRLHMLLLLMQVCGLGA